MIAPNHESGKTPCSCFENSQIAYATFIDSTLIVNYQYISRQGSPHSFKENVYTASMASG